MRKINIDIEKLKVLFPGIADGLKDDRINAMCFIIDENEVSFLKSILQETGFVFDEELLFLVYRYLLATRRFRDDVDKEHREFLNYIKEVDNLERFIHESSQPFDDIILKRGGKVISIQDKRLLNFFSFIIKIGDNKEQNRKRLNELIEKSKLSGKFPNFVSVKGGKPINYSDHVKYQLTWELNNAVHFYNRGKFLKEANIELFIGQIFAKAGWLEKTKPSNSEYLTDEDYLIKNIHNYIRRHQKFINQG